MPEAPDLPGAAALEEETVARLELREAVARLPERDQELISLRYGADLSFAEIARLLEQRRNTVQVALHRALERLRVMLESEDGHDVAHRTSEAPGL